MSLVSRIPWPLLLSSGVAVLQSLDIVKEVIGNEVMAGVLAKTREAAEAGEKISGSLRISGKFPWMPWR